MGPVCNVVDQMLFEHEAPVANRVKKRLFERTRIDTEPILKQNNSIQCVHFNVKLLVCVNLHSQRVSLTMICDKVHRTKNKKSELMLMRRSKAYSSSCSQVILVYLYPFRRNSLFCSQKSPKKSLKSNILGFKVI